MKLIVEMDRMFIKDIRQVVDEQPTVDAVPVVRCKDCVHKKCVNDSNGEGLEYCGLMFCIITDNFYCGHGERKEKEND